MKQELLEHLVRLCVREVIDQVDETKGAPAPPADGQGTADQPGIPKNKDTTTGQVSINEVDAKLKKVVKKMVGEILNRN